MNPKGDKVVVAMAPRLVRVVGLLVLLGKNLCYAFQPPTYPRSVCNPSKVEGNRSTARRGFSIAMASGSSSSSSSKSVSGPPSSVPRKNLGSYYRRPSAAIERGGGFFVPGLEGYRLRLLMGLLIFALLVINRFPGYDVGTSQLTSEAVGAAAGLVLILQSVVDRQTDIAVAERAASVASASPEQMAAAEETAGLAAWVTPNRSDVSAAGEERIRWAADVILQLTPACSVVLLRRGKVLARLGLVSSSLSSEAEEVEEEEEKAAASAAINVLSSAAMQASGGAPLVVTSAAAAVSPTADAGVSAAAMRFLPDSCKGGVVVMGTVRSNNNSSSSSSSSNNSNRRRVGNTVEAPPPVLLLVGTALPGEGRWSQGDLGYFQRLATYLAPL